MNQPIEWKCGKRIYSMQQADNVLNGKRKCQWQKEVRKYYCEKCAGWHLTSQADKTIEPENIKLNYIKKWRKLLKRKQ